MSQRWLCISNRENAIISQKKNRWGVAKRYINQINQVNQGDTLLMYTRQEIVFREIITPKIVGIYEVTAKVFEESTPLFVTPQNMGNELFPFRIKIKPIEIFADPIEFKPLIPSLSFIKNKKEWSGSIRTAMRLIPEQDYQIIINTKKE